MSDSVFKTNGNGTLTGLVDKSYSGELIIPEYVGDERITIIGNYAFSKCNDITSVSAPAVTTIGSYAFSECNNLTSVDFPAVTDIGRYAFAYCPSLTSVNFPALTIISYYAFGESSNLTSVNFPVVTDIYAYAFFFCSNLTTFYIADPNNLPEGVSSYNWSETGSSGINFKKYVKRNTKWFINAGTIIDIADAIRTKTNTTDEINGAEFADKILSIETKSDIPRAENTSF